MTNHVHLVMIPKHAASLAKGIGRTNNPLTGSTVSRGDRSGPAPTAIGDWTPYGCAGRRLDRCPGDQMINLRRVGRYLDRSAEGIERRCRRRRR